MQRVQEEHRGEHRGEHSREHSREHSGEQMMSQVRVCVRARLQLLRMQYARHTVTVAGGLVGCRCMYEHELGWASVGNPYHDATEGMILAVIRLHCFFLVCDVIGHFWSFDKRL